MRNGGGDGAVIVSVVMIATARKRVVTQVAK